MRGSFREPTVNGSPPDGGTSIEVTANSTFFAQLRLRHWGALTGRVLDENGVGMAGIPVLAYRARLPLRSAGDAKSDDRGVFRIPGLDPGKYWARSGAHEFDDGSRWLPTYSSQGREVSEALTHRVAVDVDTTNVDITPDPGRLFNIAGLVVCDTPGPVTVTLSSETGRRRTDASCGGGCRFEGVAPGRYEVFATLRNGDAAGFTELSLGRDMEAANVPVRRLPTIAIEVRWADSKDVADIPVKLIGRRKDLSETEDGREIDGPRADSRPWTLGVSGSPLRAANTLSPSFSVTAKPPADRKPRTRLIGTRCSFQQVTGPGSRLRYPIRRVSSPGGVMAKKQAGTGGARLPLAGRRLNAPVAPQPRSATAVRHRRALPLRRPAAGRLPSARDLRREGNRRGTDRAEPGSQRSRGSVPDHEYRGAGLDCPLVDG